DLAHGHPDVVASARDEDLARVGQRGDGGRVDVRVARVEPVVGIHGSSSGEEARERRRITLPCAGIIRTGTKGVLSPAGDAAPAGPLASDPKLRQSRPAGNPGPCARGSPSAPAPCVRGSSSGANGRSTLVKIA